MSAEIWVSLVIAAAGAVCLLAAWLMLDRADKLLGECKEQLAECEALTNVGVGKGYILVDGTRFVVTSVSHNFFGDRSSSLTAESDGIQR